MPKRNALFKSKSGVKSCSQMSGLQAKTVNALHLEPVGEAIRKRGTLDPWVELASSGSKRNVVKTTPEPGSLVHSFVSCIVTGELSGSASMNNVALCDADFRIVAWYTCMWSWEHLEKVCGVLVLPELWICAVSQGVDKTSISNVVKEMKLRRVSNSAKLKWCSIFCLDRL